MGAGQATTTAATQAAPAVIGMPTKYSGSVRPTFTLKRARRMAPQATKKKLAMPPKRSSSGSCTPICTKP